MVKPVGAQLKFIKNVHVVSYVFNPERPHALPGVTAWTLLSGRILGEDLTSQAKALG